MELSDLIRATNENIAATEDMKKQMIGAYGGIQGAIKQSINASERLGTAKATIETQQAAGDLEAKTQARRFATANGTNMSDAYSILPSLGMVQQAQAQRAIDQSERVAKISRNSGLDNPLGFIFDVLYGDDERATLKADQDALKTTSDSIRALNESTQTTAITQKAIAETETDATVAATEQAALAVAEEKIAEKRARIASVNVDILSTINTLNSQQLSNKFKVWQAEESNEQRQYMRQVREDAVAAKKETAAALQMEIDAYNEGAKVLGRPQVANKTGLEFRLKHDKAGVFQSIQMGAGILEHGKLIFGNNISESQANKQNYNIEITNPLDQSVFDKVDKWDAQFGSDAGDILKEMGLGKTSMEALAAYEKAKPAEKMQIRNTYYEGKFRSEANNITIGDPTNILALPSVAVLGDAVKLAEDNQFIKNYVLPDILNGGTVTFDPGKYIQAASNAVLAGELTTSEIAEGLDTVFKGLYSKGVLSKGLTSRYGLPEVKQYKVVVKSGLNADPRLALLGFGVNRAVNFEQVVDLLGGPDALNVYLSGYFRKAQSLGMMDKSNQMGGMLRNLTDGQ